MFLRYLTLVEGQIEQQAMHVEVSCSFQVVIRELLPSADQSRRQPKDSFSVTSTVDMAGSWGLLPLTGGTGGHCSELQVYEKQINAYIHSYVIVTSPLGLFRYNI